jgi:hypothetical protein
MSAMARDAGRRGCVTVVVFALLAIAGCARRAVTSRPPAPARFARLLPDEPVGFPATLVVDHPRRRRCAAARGPVVPGRGRRGQKGPVRLRLRPSVRGRGHRHRFRGSVHLSSGDAPGRRPVYGLSAVHGASADREGNTGQRLRQLLHGFERHARRGRGRRVPDAGRARRRRAAARRQPSECRRPAHAYHSRGARGTKVAYLAYTEWFMACADRLGSRGSRISSTRPRSSTRCAARERRARRSSW